MTPLFRWTYQTKTNYCCLTGGKPSFMYQPSKTALCWDWLKLLGWLVGCFFQAAGQTWILADLHVPLLALIKQNKVCLLFDSLGEISENRKWMVLAYFYQKIILRLSNRLNYFLRFQLVLKNGKIKVENFVKNGKFRHIFFNYLFLLLFLIWMHFWEWEIG